MWFGDYSALYLELGQLTPRLRRDGTPGNPNGRFTIYAGFDWRIWSPGSISGGSNSPSVASQLLGTTMTLATLSERALELEVGFSNGQRLVTVSQGGPDWYVSFRSEATVHLCVEDGILAVDRRDS